MSKTSAPHLSEFTLPGLDAPAEIVVDRWGVPHIYAAGAGDVFLAQGFNAARERLWQIDLWRRRGLGLLAEAFGSDHVERDHAARLFAYRGDMEAERAAYGPTLQLAVERFAAGVNCFVALTRERPELLPREFGALGYRPALWTGDDILRVRNNGRHHNVASEVDRAIALREFGELVERLRVRLEPDVALEVPEGLDLDAISPDVLRLYRLATAPFDAGAIEDPHGSRVGSLWGSNNWALSGARTASGRPILANDPHRALTFPSIRYAAHLSAPGVEMVGAGEAAVPGVAIGHNGRIAFGVTTFYGDQEDLYVYETNAAGDAYRYRGAWEPFEVAHESVAVRGGEPVEIELRFTRHGPVVFADPDRRVAFAVRAAWLEPGMAPYLGAVRCLGADGWDEFAAAADRWGYPGDNLAYADVGGTIAWKPVGRFPIRRGWDGLLPVPGDGRYEWDGHHDPRALPVEVDPPRGWVASANHCNVELDVLRRLNIGYEWLAGHRYERIAEVLDGAEQATVQDSVVLQGDTVSLLARAVVARLDGVVVHEPSAAWALELLRGWDCALAHESAAGALFELWVRQELAPALLRAAVERAVPGERVEEALKMLVPPGGVVAEMRPLLDLLDGTDPALGADGRAVVARIVERTLTAAVARLEQRLGPDRATWSWGRLHRVELTHPAASALGDVPAEELRAGPLSRGGSVDTVGNTAYSRTDFIQTDGTSWRMVLDVGDWDASVAVNFPGQSGNLGDAHQFDHVEPWGADDAVPLLFTRAAVEAAAAYRIILTPEA